MLLVLSNVGGQQRSILSGCRDIIVIIVELAEPVISLLPDVLVYLA